MSERPVLRRRVAYAECDMQGWVFHAHYLTWLDEAMVELWRERIGPYARFSEEGFEYVVAEVNLRYLAGARFEQEVEIELGFGSMSTTSLTGTHSIRGPEGTLLEARIRYVCIGAEGKVPWPDHVRAAFEPLCDAPG